MIYVKSVSRITLQSANLQFEDNDFNIATYDCQYIDFGSFMNFGKFSYNKTNDTLSTICTLKNKGLSIAEDFDIFCHAVIIDNKIFFQDNSQYFLCSTGRNDYPLHECLDKTLKGLTYNVKAPAYDNNNIDLHFPSLNKNILIPVSGGGYLLTLKEGWYINYMGQIYDWKGNIVE